MAGKMNREGIVVRRGDSFDILFHFRQNDGSDLDISGCSLKMCVQNGGDGSKVWELDGEIADAAAGKARLKLTPQQTKIAVGDYETDIELTLKNGDVHTIFPADITRTGLLRITKEVTEG